MLALYLYVAGFACMYTSLMDDDPTIEAPKWFRFMCLIAWPVFMPIALIVHLLWGEDV